MSSKADTGPSHTQCGHMAGWSIAVQWPIHPLKIRIDDSLLDYSLVQEKVPGNRIGEEVPGSIPGSFPAVHCKDIPLRLIRRYKLPLDLNARSPLWPYDVPRLYFAYWLLGWIPAPAAQISSSLKEMDGWGGGGDLQFFSRSSYTLAGLCMYFILKQQPQTPTMSILYMYTLEVIARCSVNATQDSTRSHLAKKARIWV